MFGSLLASVKASGKSLDSLRELMIEELRDIYDAEGQIMDALPKMEDAASDPRLKSAFRKHLQQTQGQRHRLEEVFNMLGEPVEASTCDGMKGLLTEGEVLLKAKGDPKVKDAALITAAQRVEHYEMAAYGSVRSFANTLGLRDVAEKLQQTLNEEGETDHLLTDIALGGVDQRAARA